MTVASLDATLAYLRTQFTKAEVVTLEEYGGQFDASDMAKVTYATPAIFVTELGSAPAKGSKRSSGVNVRRTRMAAFAVVKQADRKKRMRSAMALGEKIALVLRKWRPDSTGLNCEISPLDEGATCENLFNHARDAMGQAVWLVDWTQDVEPIEAPQLLDWLAVEIATTARDAVPPAAPPVEVDFLGVTQGVNFSTT
jgi:phage gp37-like protein